MSDRFQVVTHRFKIIVEVWTQDLEVIARSLNKEPKQVSNDEISAFVFQAYKEKIERQ